MKLHEVIITHRDSCKTYPLKRIGLFHLLDMATDSPTIKELWESDKFKSINEPEIGCLLIWKHKDSNATVGYWQPHGITSDSKIFCVKRFDFGHVAVYENDEFVSDVTWEDGQGTIIRLRKYSELSSPDLILKWVE